MNIGEAAQYLAAITDGEGCVYYNQKRKTRAITITNTDIDIVIAVQQCCDLLGIKYKTKIKKSKNEKHKDCYLINIYGRENLCRFSDIVPLRSTKKQTTLNLAIGTYAPKRLPLDKNWLTRKYWGSETDKGKSLQEIANEIGEPHCYVRYWFEKHGIKTKRRGRPKKSDPQY